MLYFFLASDIIFGHIRWNFTGLLRVSCYACLGVLHGCKRVYYGALNTSGSINHVSWCLIDLGRREGGKELLVMAILAKVCRTIPGRVRPSSLSVPKRPGQGE